MIFALRNTPEFGFEDTGNRSGFGVDDVGSLEVVFCRETSKRWRKTIFTLRILRLCLGEGDRVDTEPIDGTEHFVKCTFHFSSFMINTFCVFSRKCKIHFTFSPKNTKSILQVNKC